MPTKKQKIKAIAQYLYLVSDRNPGRYYQEVATLKTILDRPVYLKVLYEFDKLIREHWKYEESPDN